MRLEIKDSGGRILQTVDLANGEYTISVSGSHGESPQLTQASLKPIGRSLFLLFLCTLLFSFEQYIERAHENRESVVVLKNILETFSKIVFSVGILSVISRALTHKYQVWRCSTFVLYSFLGYFFWSENLMGLRWFLPNIFWIKEVYNLIFVAWATTVLWYLMKIMFHQLHPMWRKMLVSVFVAFIMIYNVINFLPFRREYSFYRINTPPPRPEVLESSALTLEEFLKTIPEGQSGAN